MSHSADYRSQPEATLEVPQLSGKARCPRRLSVMPGYPTAAGYARLVRDHARGLLGHERLGRLEQHRARPDELELVLAFNSGEYQSISATAWFAANPAELLATNFGVPAATFAGFPKAETPMPD